ncbi:hypothetical protein pb186bvf_016815 [Paramecium bursaria]
MLQKNINNSSDYSDLRQFLGYMEKKYKLIDVIRFLAEGSYGKVYQVKCDGQNFAIKVQKGKIGDAEKKLYELMKKNKFQNLVNTIDYLEGMQFSYVMMEYCSRDLYHDIKNGKIEQLNIMYIVRQIVKGIEELHQNKIIHRDLKPENILIFEIKANNRTQYQYKIADFGTNFQIKNEYEILAKTLVGTPYYIAPEVGQDKKTYDLKADIWSLGVIIFELLLGQPPFNGRCIEDFQKQTRDQNEINLKLQYLYSKQEFHNYKLIDIVQQALNQDPQKRPSIEEIVQILQPVISKSVEKKGFNTQDQQKQKSITIHQDIGKQLEQISKLKHDKQKLNNNKIFQSIITTSKLNFFTSKQQSQLRAQDLRNQINDFQKSIRYQLSQQLDNIDNLQQFFQGKQIIQIPQTYKNQFDPKNDIIKQLANGGSKISTNQSDIEKSQNESQISNNSKNQNNTKFNFNPQLNNNPQYKTQNKPQRK